MKVRTRFAPSPTGYLHIGGARTALFNWLYAQKHGGEYVLRIEDTDKDRSKDEFTDDILSSLSWLGIHSSLEPVYQSKRTDLYNKLLTTLLDSGNAYYCYCSRERLDKLREEQIKNKHKPRYDGTCRNLDHAPGDNANPVIRLRNPQHGNITLHDEVRGEVTVQNSELDDLILARSDGSPTYHMTVVADDIEMQITHIIRGDDHLNNTFRQHNIFTALGHTPPIYAHIPLIHGSDGKRLSKRHGAVSVNQYRRDGFLAAGLLNYLVRLGWSHGDQELFDINEMVEKFDLKSVQQSAATFDIDKLLWVNHQHMKSTSGNDMKENLTEFFTAHDYKFDDNPELTFLFDTLKERNKTLLELCTMSQFLYEDINHYDEKAVKKNFSQDKVEILNNLKLKLSNIDEWKADNIHIEIKNTVEELGLKFGNVAPPLRLAVTGGAESPSIDNTLELLGAEKTLKRIQQAIEYITTSV